MWCYVLCCSLQSGGPKKNNKGDGCTHGNSIAVDGEGAAPYCWCWCYYSTYMCSCSVTIRPLIEQPRTFAFFFCEAGVLILQREELRGSRPAAAKTPIDSLRDDRRHHECCGCCCIVAILVWLIHCCKVVLGGGVGRKKHGLARLWRCGWGGRLFFYYSSAWKFKCFELWGLPVKFIYGPELRWNKGQSKYFSARCSIWFTRTVLIPMNGFVIYRGKGNMKHGCSRF